MRSRLNGGRAPYLQSRSSPSRSPLSGRANVGRSAKRTALLGSAQLGCACGRHGSHAFHFGAEKFPPALLFVVAMLGGAPQLWAANHVLASAMRSTFGALTSFGGRCDQPPCRRALP